MDNLETLIVSSPSNSFVIYNKILGKGAYGAVLLSKKQRSEQYYAMKIVLYSLLNEDFKKSSHTNQRGLQHEIRSAIFVENTSFQYSSDV